MKDMRDYLLGNLFYSIEKAIKLYRQFAQRRLKENGLDITIDQWLVLKALNDDPEQTQHQIADTVFKDYASITRMIDLLVHKKYLARIVRESDRRRFRLSLTVSASKLLEVMEPLLEKNRRIALSGISEVEKLLLQKTLGQIITNCKRQH